MLGDTLASRFEFGNQTTEDKYGRHVSGTCVRDGSPVVMTVLDPQLQPKADDANAVIKVSQTLAKKKLGGILLAVEAGKTEGGNIYIISRTSSAPTLKSLLKTSGGMSPEDALTIAYQIAVILKNAADAGVHHLELSSNSILVNVDDTPQVQIAGFGIAKLLPSYNPSKKNVPYHGVAEYMAPEVCAGREGDAASDLYALGILMYEMLAGKPPFQSSSPSTTIKRQVYEKPLPLHLVKPSVTNLDAFEQLTNRFLHKEPKQRPETLAEAVSLIEELANSSFPDAKLIVPEALSDEIEPISHLAQEVVAEAAAPAPVASGTMVFTGLAEAMAEGQAPGGTPKTPSSGQATEAFDADFVKAALEQAAAKGGVQKEEAAPVAPAPAAKEPAAEKPVEAPVATPEPAVEKTPAAEPAAKEEVQEPAPSTEAADTAAPVADAQEEPAPVVTPGPAVEGFAQKPDPEKKKESRMVWILSGILIALIAVGVFLFMKSSKVDDVPPPQPTPTTQVEVAPAPEPAAPAEPAAPQKAEEADKAAVKEEGDKKAEEAKEEPAAEAPAQEEEAPRVVIKPAGPTPQEKAAALVNRAKVEIKEGRPEDAKDSLETALQMDPDNADAKLLLEVVAGRIKAKAAEAKAEAAAKKPAAPATRKVTTAPAKPAPKAATAEKPPKAEPKPQMSDAERNAKIQELLKAGQAALNAGDNAKAISYFNQVLKLDPNNKLAPRLLQRAKAGQ